MAHPNADAPLPIDEFDYDLPPERIAQHPVEPRDASRLLVLDKQSGSLEDHVFRDLPALLNPNDLIVLNDTRVRAARLRAQRQTGGAVELLMLDRRSDGSWSALAKPARRLRIGEQLTILSRSGEPDSARVTFNGRDGSVVLVTLDDETAIERCGYAPIPPYIHAKLDDPERYQTVYADQLGSAAAPTAGLHFTTSLLDACEQHGIEIAKITLHVGLDTFKPVTEADARQHEIHSEWFHVPPETLAAIRTTRQRGGRVIAVGTTVVRTLESVADKLDANQPQVGNTRLYITPGYQFQAVDGMVTNFHLPRTTLLLLVSAMASWDHVRAAYEHAIDSEYRFYSFGDAMLIV